MKIRGVLLGAVCVIAASVGVVSPVAADDSAVVTETGEALEIAGSMVEHAAPLDEVGDGFVSRVGGSEVELPADPSEPLVLDGAAGEIGVGLPVVAGADDGVVDESGAVVYESDTSAVSLAAQATFDGGLQVLVVIDGPSAPSEYRFDMTVPAGATLESTLDGGAQVVGADGHVVVKVEPAWALDANGNSVPTQYRVEGTTLVQVIDHAAATYPVVGDPKYTWGIISGTVYLNRTETNKLILGTAITSIIAYGFGGWTGAVPASVAAVAAYHYNEGRCVKVKLRALSTNGLFTWELGSYGGSHAGGYCR